MTGSAGNGAPGVIVVAPEALAELVHAAVSEAMADARPPALVDRSELARQLGVSTRHVAELERRGLPVVRVGQAPRYELQAALGWLRS